MAEPILSADEHLALAEAIRAAEAGTDGEIYCVVARASDGYFHVAALFLTLWALAMSLGVAVLLHLWWMTMPLPHFVATQGLAVGAGLLLLHVAPGLRIRLVPRGIGYRRAHANAVRQFLAHNIHVTQERTGLLVFVSLAERYAEIIADAGIAEKVDQRVWDGIVAGLLETAVASRLAEGLSQAISASGAVLGEHFPRRPGNRNELPDRVVEI